MSKLMKNILILIFTSFVFYKTKHIVSFGFLLFLNIDFRLGEIYNDKMHTQG